MELTVKYTEHELITLLKARSEDAFNYLYEHFGGGLYSTILQIIPDEELAGSILQETFLYTIHKVNSFDERNGKLFTWMLNVARNLSLDRIKSKSYGLHHKTAAAVSTAGDGKTSMFAEKAAGETGIRKALKYLAPEQVGLIELAYFRGYTQEEIAGEKGISIALVKEKLRNALLQLRAYLK